MSDLKLSRLKPTSRKLERFSYGLNLWGKIRKALT